MPEPDDAPLPAGRVGPWLERLGTPAGGDVPCDGCTACCTSAQFVHVAADEADALAHLPKALLFAAPGLPPGHVVLPFDQQGRCPMLGEHGCTIYDHRPRTCRTYDCRVFAAAAVTPDKPLIAARAARWRFDDAAPEDAALHAAVRAVAQRLRRDLTRPLPPTQLAYLATRVAHLFLDDSGLELVDPDVDVLAAAVEAITSAPG